METTIRIMERTTRVDMSGEGANEDDTTAHIYGGTPEDDGNKGSDKIMESRHNEGSNNEWNQRAVSPFVEVKNGLDRG
jgi:hypothetical protein